MNESSSILSMEVDEEIREEVLDLDRDDEEEKEEEGLNPLIHTSYESKLREILRKLCSAEAILSLEASKEFICLLRGDSGGEILRHYVQASPDCSELLDAWKHRQRNPSMADFLSLVSAILDHPSGKSESSGIRARLDKFTRSIIKSKLDDIYVELNCQEHRRQRAALSLLASMVRRNRSIAADIADIFDFKLLQKFAGDRKRKRGKEMRHTMKNSTRHAFVGFAMSFLEVGSPWLLRSILRQKDMYSGVLRGLGSDNVETVVYVLSTLRDKVLTANSLVTPGLRSVLFGSVTLEQLSYISGNPMAGPSADIAHEVLVMVCTDPCNGLMPNSNLKGNEKRLLDLMKKLKATEVQYHKDLLLAILNRRPSLCPAYMDGFPYHLEPRSSSLWFAAISLVVDVISSMSAHSLLTCLASRSSDLPTMESNDLQCILKCIIPRAFSRSVINKGLLHFDILVRHGYLRLLLESLKLLHRLICAIDDMVENMTVKEAVGMPGEGLPYLVGLPGFNSFVNVGRCLADDGIDTPYTDEQRKKYVSLRQYLQDEVRAVLPDPQVLFKLLSPLHYKSSKKSGISLKGCANLPEVGLKKLKSTTSSNETIDIVISGMDAEHTTDIPEYCQKVGGTLTMVELDVEKDHTREIAQIWGLNELAMVSNEPKDAEIFFHSKLLDVLTFYLRTMPIALEGSFDLFKILPDNPLSLSVDQQQSLLSLLIEYIGLSPGSRASPRTPELMYKHLQPLITVFIGSKVKSIQDQAYLLSRAAMLSTGAFNQNLSEIDAWFFFLTGYNRGQYPVEIQGTELFHDLSAAVISFLCDAVSTVGDNLYKYLDHLRNLIFNLEGFKGDFPDFSPLIICILQKCLRLLEPDSGTLKLYERSMISLYVCNTLSFLLQTQVDMRTLPGLIKFVITKKFKDLSDSRRSFCEWRPLINLLHLARSILDQQSCSLFSIPESTIRVNGSSFLSVLGKVKEFIGHGHDGSLVGVGIAFSSSIICATPDDIVETFPDLITVAQLLSRAYFPFLSLVLFLEPKFLADVAKRWPDMFFSSLQMTEGSISKNCRDNNGQSLSCDEACHCIGKSISTEHLDSKESAASAFHEFLKHAPFYIIFPTLLSFSNCKLHSTQMLDVLRVKLSGGSFVDSISLLRYLLFWTYQIYSSYRAQPSDSDVLEKMFQICFTLIEYMLEHVLILTSDNTSLKTGASLATNYVEDIVDIIFHHPVVRLSLSDPLSSSRKPANESLRNSLEAFVASAEQSVHPMDRRILHLLKNIFHSLLAFCNAQNSVSKVHNAVTGPVLKAAKHLVEQTVLLFREKFDLYVSKKDLGPLLPSFYTLHALMRFISPFELLELVQWIFRKLDDNLSSWTSAIVSALSVGLFIADGAFDMLCCYLHQQNMKSESHWFWEMKSFDASILPKVYYKILDFAICFRLECADICLLKAVNAGYNGRYVQPHPALLPLHMLLSRMIVDSPMKLLMHCFYPTSKIKAKTLFWLTEVSPLHLSLFGKTFLGILNKDLSALDVLNVDGAWPLISEVTDENGNFVLSHEDFVLLLPAALSYLTSNLDKVRKQDLNPFGTIPMFYSRILLDGFSSWKSYVSENIFQENYGEFVPTCLDDFCNLFSSSLLGKAVDMLRYFFIFNASSMNEELRLNIFYSTYPDSSVLEIDCDIRKVTSCSYKESLKIINEVIAKISFTRLLLFPPEVDENSNGKPSRTESDEENRAKLKFMSILVSTLDLIIRKSPLNQESFSSLSVADCYHVVRFLELSIVRNIAELSMKMQSYLTQLPSIPFLKPLIRSSFLHRFEDPVTLKAIRCILVTLPVGRFFVSDVLELLLGHSQFVSTILCSDSISDSSGFTPTAMLLQPVPSTLKLLDFSCTDQNAPDGRGIDDTSSELGYKHCILENRKLELIKLLRILYHLMDQHHNIGPVSAVGMNSRELLSLLLSGYRATLSETDLETLHLMHEIEPIKESDLIGELYYPPNKGSDPIGELDYLWGVSALRIRKEQTVDRLLPVDCETVEERRKRLFRENIPVDSKVCAMTVLHFCYDRASRTAPISLKKLKKDKFMDTAELITCTKMDMVQHYDPAFLLRFAAHSLSRGYIEPMEFSRLGLLAIAFVSMSSPEKAIRKLGYVVLREFKKALENYQTSKDLLPLQFLLTYLQNGIAEEWQKIPSAIAIFAAETSFLLLDPSQSTVVTISELLMNSPSVDLKNFPLLHKLLGKKGSNYSKTDLLWVLRALYAGLNLDDDDLLCIKNILSKLLLSFDYSSLPDPESKILILQTMKKAAKLHMLSRYLVRDCGLLSWLSSVLLSFDKGLLCGDHKEFSLKVIVMVLEIIVDVLSSRNITEWLQKYALEQLSELSSYLHMLFVGALKFPKENVSLVNSILHVLTSTLRISQKRKIYQPHFSLSIEGLYLLHQVIDDEFGNEKFSATIELGLNAILMSSPMPVIFHMDKARLSKLLMWGTTVALQSCSKQGPLTKEHDPHLVKSSEALQGEESLLSKLLRWVTASVILGGISNQSCNINTSFSLRKSKFRTLQSLLEEVTKRQVESSDKNCSTNAALAGIVLYLQQLLGRNYRGLRSVISSLCLLLLSDASNTTESEFSDEVRGSRVVSLCSKIRCPFEANPAWRWSFYEPWRDLSSGLTEIEQIEEQHACQSLLVIFSNAIGGKSLGLQGLSLQDVERSVLFAWERNAIFGSR